MCRRSATVCLVKSPALAGCSGLSPAERLVGLPDPRHRRGVRHPFVAVLLIAASAVVAGARSYAGIGQWARNAPRPAPARLGARLPAALNVHVAPSAATIRRIIVSVCPGGLADLTGESPQGAESVAADGKSARVHVTTMCRPRTCSPRRPATAAPSPSRGSRTRRMKSPASPRCWNRSA